jgi:stearoyl-CoA desaturase (delta-9 desaturase)
MVPPFDTGSLPAASAALGSKPEQLTRDWPVIIFMAGIHIIAFAFAYATFTWPAFIAAVVLYYATGMIGVTLGLHRLLTHRSFKTTKTVERVLATFGTLALQGSVLEWVGHHRMHHAGSDTPKDPHNARRGFWWSHMGWLFVNDPEFDDDKKLRRFARDIAADPYMNWISSYPVMIGMQIALGLLLLATMGWSGVVWGICVRLVVVYHVTWLVNSATHMWGYRNFPDADDLTHNNWFVGIVAFGEGWHNNHHSFPDCAPNGFRWWEFDLTWQVIKVLRFFNLAWDIKTPSKEILNKAV